MKFFPAQISVCLLAASLATGTAHASLQGRDLDGNLSTIEAYYDSLLNITWLADANYAKSSGYDSDGWMSWDDANAWADQLSFTDGTQVYDNWRLPTVSPINNLGFGYAYSTAGDTDFGFNMGAPGTLYAGSSASELAHMYYQSLGNPGLFDITGTNIGCDISTTDTCLDNVLAFENIQPGVYWFGTEYNPNPPPTPAGSAWTFNMGSGYQSSRVMFTSNFAWAVSPGDTGVAAVPEADTWAMLLAGLGLVGFAAGRRGRHTA